MKTVKVIFKNDDSITTRINGTEDEIRAYYVGYVFNIGDVKMTYRKQQGLSF
ncbi:MAG: hypothetical protein LBR46_05480 [Prevotella sp.]|jgi:hypothetical protein|nr:hypothetical protein [Prevotella sp.]